MRQITTTTISNITCDLCWKQILTEEQHITFSSMTNDAGIRIFEKEGLKNINTKHLVAWKTISDFCSIECARSFIQKTTDEFLREINPINNRSRGTSFLQ